ncbi:MAG: hypothetical protein JXA14_22945 [Anaerolineae bacterium]|nr:hypothetical protein [Anaerolineae bacterium]
MGVNRHVVSWDSHAINDGTNFTAVLLPARGLPGVELHKTKRLTGHPLISSVERKGQVYQIRIAIEDESNVETLRQALELWFDYEDETAKVFVIEDDDGSNDRYVYAVCRALDEVPGSASRQFVATIETHGDVRWRSTTPATDSWSITASGQTKVVANDGNDDAYPIFTIEPTGAKTSNTYGYRAFVPIRWPKDTAYLGYPLDIVNNGLDTAALILAGKMQADGDDLRVTVDGVEVDRWLDDIDDATTKVYCNLDFKARAEGLLAEALTGSGSVAAITLQAGVNMRKFPDAGLLAIGSEVFVYTAKDEVQRQFTGITPGAKNTTQAAHSIGDTVWWCQHEVWIWYGNSSATAPDTDDDYKPAFELDHSTNASWVYEQFGEDDGKRTGAWKQLTYYGKPDFYGGNQYSDADPWTDMGVAFEATKGKARLALHNPMGISNVAITNGEKYSSSKANMDAWISSSANGGYWYREYTIPDPSADDTWEAWSRSEAITSSRPWIGVAIENKYRAQTHRIEFSDCTVTLATSPTVSLGSEEAMYSLDCVIENQTTGESIRVTAGIKLNQELEVNTDERTVTLLDDGSNQYQAVARVEGPRINWLPLAPGNNTLKFTDDGTDTATIGLQWDKRWR